MNFLAHYHFYKTENIYYNTGLVLPDLVKAFCKTHIRFSGSYTRPIFISLKEGSEIHLESDKRFHQSDFFFKSERHIAGILDPKAKWPRKFFFNHLLCEIILDRVLMEANPELCSAFYNNLRATEASEAELFLKLSGIPNYQNFKPGYERFVNLQFIFDYMHNEKIILALSRVYSRVGIQYVWTEEDKELLNKHIPDFIAFIGHTAPELNNELKIK